MFQYLYTLRTVGMEQLQRVKFPEEPTGKANFVTLHTKRLYKYALVYSYFVWFKDIRWPCRLFLVILIFKYLIALIILLRLRWQTCITRFRTIVRLYTQLQPEMPRRKQKRVRCVYLSTFRAVGMQQLQQLMHLDSPTGDRQVCDVESKVFICIFSEAAWDFRWR